MNKTTTGCEIKLSQHSMVFPGTSLRVVLLRGTVTQVSAAASSILNLCAQSAAQVGGWVSGSVRLQSVWMMHAVWLVG